MAIRIFHINFFTKKNTANTGVPTTFIVFCDDDDLQCHGSMALLKIQTPSRYKEIVG